MRALGAEGILSLAPTLILLSDEAGPPDVLRILEKAGPTLIRVPDDASAEGIVRRIEAVARALSAEPAGLALAREVETGFERLKDRRGALTRSVRALFILSIQNGKPLVGGRGTAADAMLALAGADNAASALEGWKPMSDEGVIAAAPDALVTMDRGPGGAPPDPFALPAFAAVPAARRQGLVVMDGLYLLGFGPRTPAAALDLMAALAAAAARRSPGRPAPRGPDERGRGGRRPFRAAQPGDARGACTPAPCGRRSGARDGGRPHPRRSRPRRAACGPRGRRRSCTRRRARHPTGAPAALLLGCSVGAALAFPAP